MGFVDDEQDIAALACQVMERGTELWEKAHKAESRLNLEGEEDFAVECGDTEVRVGQVDQGVEVAVESLGKGADSGRLAGADVAGNESGETALQGEGQATLDFAVTTRGIKVLGGDGFGKGGL
jgi:hypothetical protein